MHPVRGPVILIIAVALAACTGAAVEETAPPSLPAEISGRIVVLDSGGNIVTVDPDGGNRVEITDDGDSSRYFQPIWSPDRLTLAWGVADSDGFAVGIAADDGSDRRRVEMAGFPFYLNWSPDGEQIGTLHGGSGGTLAFEVVDPVAESSMTVDTGSPYYFSWSPESDALVVHVDGDRLEIFDESANPTDIGPTSPSFSAPHWTPTGIFYLGPDGVTLRADDGELDVLSEASGFVGINPNSQGSLVAIHSLSGQGGVTVGLEAQEEGDPSTVSILDLESGEIDTVATGLSVGSFWSPAGTRLLILEVNANAGAVDLVVWEAGETRTLTTIEVPGSLITEALAFFDQYAQSWQMWSPDSNAIVLPGSIGDAAGIWVVGIDGADPLKIADGEWAAWSHG
jgi:hypothetical protein